MFPYVSLGNISNTRKSVSSEKWLKSKCFYSFSIFRQGGPVNNGNWTEWSTVWAGIVRVIWNHKYGFRPNCTTGGQLPFLLYPFWNCSNNGLAQFRYFIDAVLSRFEITFILFFWGGNKSFKICHMILFVFHFPAIWLVTLNKLWNLIGCFFFWCSLLIGWEKDAI